MTTPVAPSPRHLILHTSTSNPDFNGDLDLGVVELSPTVTALILERHRQVAALAATDRQFHCGCWFDVSCVFVAADLDRLQELRPDVWRALDDQGWTIVEKAIDDLGLEPQRTEVDLVNIDERNAWWSARPKHCDVTVETLPVPVAVFFEVIKK